VDGIVGTAFHAAAVKGGTIVRRIRVSGAMAMRCLSLLGPTSSGAKSDEDFIAFSERGESYTVKQERNSLSDAGAPFDF
jgi:hypothetical protein